MTTLEIETAANRGNLATADFNIQQTLRRQVIPAFLEDIGPCSWRKAYETITTVAGTQSYDLADAAVTGTGSLSFLKMHEAYRLPSPPYAPLKYIGEDPLAVSLAEATTDQAGPTAYYITLDGSTPKRWRRLKFQAPPDAVYSIQCVKLMFVRFTDDSTTVDMMPFLPEQLHWALVDGLRAKVFFDRFGQGDARYDRAQADYLGWVERARNLRELARRNYFVSVR